MSLSDLVRREPSVVAAGAGILADAVAAQAVSVTRVDWQPPMEGTAADLAVVAADPLRTAANARAVAAVLDVQARLVDVLPASEVLGLGAGDFLHAGPPIEWERAAGPLRGALMGAAVGRDGFPRRWVMAVLACRPMAKLGARQPRPAEYWPSDVADLAEQLLSRRMKAD